MIIDTSALIALGRNEPSSDEVERALATADVLRMSAATSLELGIVADTYDLAAVMDEYVRALGIEIVPMTAEDARRARAAHRRYGRRSGSPAKLNFGDCIAYALSARLGEPLLFVGDDFTHTDVLPAR